MKGVFNDRPALPKYKTTWDVGTVLSYLKGIEDISLMQLSCRLCILFLLLSAQRCQTLHLVQIDDILLSDTSLIIHPNHVLKQTRPGSHLEPITFQSYDKDKKLCIVYTMEQYLDRTKHLRQGQNLIISTMRPFKAASKNTIGRWVKLVLSKAGVDRCFTTHSTRSAATSMAKLKGVPLQSIMRSAGWSNAKTFAKFYDKPLDTEKQSIQSAILGTVE
ncbi:MAG: tyrosine-type recombinase/integrase [Candidatus Thiodiazotropha taylori]|nr:tyrosine-type recombinase/integrase [Candidatus Thiodiazotropha taylori]MCW4333982.1 tyrosine-type recombinase/integrase [Candidatus Thiodiazotropha endolucinida]